MTGDLTEDPATESQPVKEDPYTTNPLTGVKNLDKSKVSLRPVAVMINNIRIAQQVQTSVQKADVIYETEIEGGITRLMAVFKDIGEIGQLGTVRSARYAFIDLALGYDAIYVHCGIDPTYAAPHVQSSGVADFNINSNPFAAYGFREKNGLSYEHTMYTSGEKLQEGFQNLEVRTTTQKTDSWCPSLSSKYPPSKGESPFRSLILHFFLTLFHAVFSPCRLPYRNHPFSSPFLPLFLPRTPKTFPKNPQKA